MKEILDYLLAEYKNLESEKAGFDEDISALAIEIDKTRHVVNQMTSYDETIDVFQASSKFYEDQEFNEEESKILMEKIGELELKKSDLESKCKNMNKKMLHINSLMDLIQENDDKNIKNSEKINDLVDEIEEKVDFCKKIAINDSKRTVLELEKITKNLRKIEKLLGE